MERGLLRDPIKQSHDSGYFDACAVAKNEHDRSQSKSKSTFRLGTPLSPNRILKQLCLSGDVIE